MWAALIILAQVFGSPQPGGQQDLDLCTGKTKSSREESIPACHRVVSKGVLDKISVGKAYLLLARGAHKPGGAISYLNQTIAQDPENGDYYRERGFQYHLLSDYDRALSEYETALALKPGSSYTYFVRALTFTRKGEDARARAWKSIVQRPRSTASSRRKRRAGGSEPLNRVQAGGNRTFSPRAHV